MTEQPDLFNGQRLIGATSDETEARLGMAHQTISARYTELRQWAYIDYWRTSDGRIVERITRQGSNAAVHVLTRKGKNAVELGFPIRPNETRDATEGFHGGEDRSARAHKNSTRGSSTLRLEVLRDIHKRTPPFNGGNT